MYENTWKCGELEDYFSPSSGGLKQRRRKTALLGYGIMYPECSGKRKRHARSMMAAVLRLLHALHGGLIRPPSSRFRLPPPKNGALLELRLPTFLEQTCATWNLSWIVFTACAQCSYHEADLSAHLVHPEQAVPVMPREARVHSVLTMKPIFPTHLLHPEQAAPVMPREASPAITKREAEGLNRVCCFCL